MVQLNFNATQVQPNRAPEPVPSGLYPVTITKSEEKPTKDGQGAYLEFEMTVVQGHEFAGRKIYDRLNIKNKNQQTVDIAYSTLSSICHVTGRLQIQDTGQLHGVPFQVLVSKVERNDRPGSGEMTNQVKGYKDINGNDPGLAGVTQGGGQPSWAGGGNAPQQQQPQNTQQWQPQGNGNAGQAPQNNGNGGQAWQQPQQGNGQQPQQDPNAGYQQQPQGQQPQQGAQVQPQNNGGQAPQDDTRPPWLRN